MMLGLEFLVCIVTALSLFLFAHGCAHWAFTLGRLRSESNSEPKSELGFTSGIHPNVVWCSLGLLALVTISGVLTEFRSPGVFAAEVIFWLVVASGARPALRQLSVPFWKNSTSVLMLATGAFYCLFWFIQFSDNASLPSRDDGVAHLSWLVDIHRTGFAHLGKVPVHFENEFGKALNPFYPTGMQALIAAISGVWMRLGVLPTTTLKVWLVLTHTALLLTLLWALQYHWKKIPQWLLIVVALVASTAFRVPMDASTEGGLARIFAMAVVFPVSFYIAAKDTFSLKQFALMGCIGFLGAFLLHPSAFWVFGLSLAFAAVFEWKRIEFKVNKDVVLFAGACVVSAGMLGWILYANGSTTTPLVVEQKYVGIAGLFKKFSQFFQVMLAGTYSPISITRPLFHVGIIGFWWLVKNGTLSTRVMLYHVMLFLFSLIVMASDVFRFPGASAIGGAFYYEPARAACMLHLTVWIFILASLPVLEAAAGKILGWMKRSSPDAEKNEIGSSAVPFPRVWIGLAAAFQIANWFSTPRVMHSFDTAFNTPKLKKLSTLEEFIATQTPRNTVIAAAPFDLDILGPLTRRHSLFIYGDFVPKRDANGSARLAWYNEKIRRIEDLLLDKDLRSTCSVRELFAPFTRPVVFIIDTESDILKQAAEEAQGAEICNGLKHVGRMNERLVFIGGG